MSDYETVPQRPKFHGEGKKFGVALDHWWSAYSRRERDAFMNWYRSASIESRAAWFKYFRTRNLRMMYGDPGLKLRTRNV